LTCIDRPETALVVAHPGHELRLTAWIAETRPWLFILTKGARSGHTEDRIETSLALAPQLGARPGRLFGVAFDVDVYAQILGGDTAYFDALTDSLRDALIAAAVTRVVTDGWQNYNPAHDLTHLIARVAAAEAAVACGQEIEVLDYPVVLGSMAGSAPGPEVWRAVLTPEAAAEKIALAAIYPGLTPDVAGLHGAAGRRAFDTESLHSPRALAELVPLPGQPPWYERHGEARVRAGVYERALRWEHMAPVVSALASRLAAAEATGLVNP
jgi:hypothetical protein